MGLLCTANEVNSQHTFVSAFYSVWPINPTYVSTFLIMSPVQTMSDIKVSPRERDIILKYDLDMEGCEDWDLNRWEEYEIDTWNLKQELMGRYYQIFPSYEEGETEEDKEEREKWEEEEEIAKQK